MASTNGIMSLSPQPQSADASLTLSAKRKRDDSAEVENPVNGSSESKNGITDAFSVEETKGLIRDLIDVLKAQDTTPSILTRSIPERAPSAEPRAKRQKAEDDTGMMTTIMTRHAADAYKSVDDVLLDIDAAVSDIKEMLQPLNGASRHQHIPESEISLKVSAFQERAHTLIRRERLAKSKATSHNKEKLSGINANGSIGAKLGIQANARPTANKIALTLYGNAPGPKQLFSSLQIPTKLDGENEDILQTLHEAGLPNGINTTQIIPMQSTGLVGEKRRPRTLGELFPAPANVPAMQPPKPSKVATTRSSTVGWYKPATGDAPSRNASYFKQAISSGQWLDYTNASPPQDMKRRSRERAMSFGGSKAPQLDSELSESEPAKLAALFRSAYSGFAPSKDDSAAVAPEGHMNRLWWQKIGEKSFERYVETINNPEEAADVGMGLADSLEELDVEKLEEMANEEDQDMVDPSLVPLSAVVEKSAKEKDVEEVLAGISELLETLNSYQRNRHASLNASARPNGHLSAPDSVVVGTPSKPSESEQATYEMLRTSLELMIATLPPYAVAKLDSSRLSDLSISTKIEVQLEDHKGTMEEDENAARMKALSAASNTARPAPPTSHRTGSSAQLYGNQYAASRPAAGHQYYGGTSTPVRPPSSSMQRPPATAPAPFPSHRPAAATTPYRPSYGNTGYPQQQNARPAQPHYGASTPQQYNTPVAQPYMRPSGQSYQQQTAPQSVQHNNMNGAYQRQPSYPQQPGGVPQSGMAYPYGNTSNVPRQSSPQKAYSPQQSAAQPRPYSSSTPTPSMGPTQPPYLQNPMVQSAMHGTPSQSPQPSFQQRQPTTTMPYNTSFMTQAEQSSMMDRQRAQLAQQQGMQQQARTAAQASMVSPSKSQVTGNPVPAGL